MKCINEGHILKVIRIVHKCNGQLFDVENIPLNTCAKHVLKATTLVIVQSTGLHLS